MSQRAFIERSPRLISSTMSSYEGCWRVAKNSSNGISAAIFPFKVDLPLPPAPVSSYVAAIAVDINVVDVIQLNAFADDARAIVDMNVVDVVQLNEDVNPLTELKLGPQN